MSFTIKGEKEIFLTRNEYRIFRILYENVNNLVVYERLYGDSWEGDDVRKRYYTANVIHHIRAKLPKEYRRIIRIVRTKGYMLKEPTITYQNNQR